MFPWILLQLVHTQQTVILPTQPRGAFGDMVKQKDDREKAQKLERMRRPVNTLLVPGEDDNDDGIVIVASFMTNQLLYAPASEFKEGHAQPKLSLFAGGSYCGSKRKRHACSLLDGPWGLAARNGVVFVSSFGSDQIMMFSTRIPPPRRREEEEEEDILPQTLRRNRGAARYLGAFGGAEILSCPEGIAWGPEGSALADTLFVASFLSNSVVAFTVAFDDDAGDPRATRSYTFVDGYASALSGAEDLAWCGGSLYVSSYYSDTVLRFDRNGVRDDEFAARIDAERLRGLELAGPVGIECSVVRREDGAGAEAEAEAGALEEPDAYLDLDLRALQGLTMLEVLVASYKNSKIARFTLDGSYLGDLVGSGARGLNGPSGFSILDRGWVSSLSCVASELLVASYETSKLIAYPPSCRTSMATERRRRESNASFVNLVR